MGSSFTEYRGRRFWARDLKLEVWLYVLGLIVDRQPVRPAWLVAAREHWRLQATVGFQGTVGADLDGQVGTDPGRAELLIGLAERAELYLRRHKMITAGELVDGGVGGPQVDWDSDLDTEVIWPAFVVNCRVARQYDQHGYARKDPAGDFPAAAAPRGSTVSACLRVGQGRAVGATVAGRPPPGRDPAR
ncbi:MAG TPA: hypothetical protein VMU51_35660 [Mycobacteriales bacterium]|nr:hypothetical protein [Mycobacteriales bacterium]